MHIYVLSLSCADVMMITRDNFVMTFSRLLKVYTPDTYVYYMFILKCSTVDPRLFRPIGSRLCPDN